MMMMMMTTTTKTTMTTTATMNDRNELLELQSNVKFQTTKQAGGKEFSSSTNYPVCSKERVYLRTFKSEVFVDEADYKTCSQLRSLFVVSTKH